MKQSFPVFIINVPRDVLRRKKMETQMDSMGVEYSFVEGVYGDDLRVASRYNEERALKEQGKPLTVGEKGCALSHALLYEKMVKENIPYAVILEDDAILPSDFIALVEHEIAKNNGTWDWLSFDYRMFGFSFLSTWITATYTTIKQKPSFFFYACVKIPYMFIVSVFESARNFLAIHIPAYRGAKFFFRPLYNAGAYIITLEGARKLLPFTSPLRMSADRTPNIARMKVRFKLYGYVPLSVHQDATFESNTIRSDEDWKVLDR